MIPKNLKYGSKVESSFAKLNRSNIAPQNGTGPYNLGDTIIVNIPTRANLVLDTSNSYFKFNVSLTTTADDTFARWDSCGAHGIIQRLRVFSGSNLIQDIDNYGLLAKMLFDIQVSQDANIGKYSITTGTRNDYTTTSVTTTATPCVMRNSGASIFSKTADNTTVTKTYCLSLISLLGTLCSNQYLPLFGATSAPLRTEIQLVSVLQNALGYSVALPTFTMSNVEYVGSFIELGDQAMRIIEESLEGQPLQFCIPDYRNYQYNFSLTGGVNTQVSMPIPAKFSSLKSLFVTVRDNTGAINYFPFSCNGYGFVNYYFRVGSQIMPTKLVETKTEAFCELLKATATLSDILHTPSIDITSYTDDTNNPMTDIAVGATDATKLLAFVTAQSNSFYIGIDVENYSNAPKDSIFSGMNTNTDDIFFTGTFKPTSTTTARFDSFALFDEVIVFENGTCYVKF